MIILDFDYELKTLELTEEGEDSYEVTKSIDLGRDCEQMQQLLDKLRKQHCPHNLVVEPEVITANNFMFNAKHSGGHLSRFSVESKNLIQGIDMRQGEV